MNINLSNYKNYLLGYIDNQLDDNERLSLEAFLAANPAAKKELGALKATKLQPDKKIVFPDKQLLLRDEATPVYNTEEEAPIRKLFWYRATAVAAAAMLAGLVVWFSFFHGSHREVMPVSTNVTERTGSGTLPVGKGTSGTLARGGGDANAGKNRAVANAPEYRFDNFLKVVKSSRQKMALQMPEKTGQLANAPERELRAEATTSLSSLPDKALQTPEKTRQLASAPEQNNPAIVQTQHDAFVAATNKVALQIPEKTAPVANAPEHKKGLLRKIGDLLGAHIKLKTKDAEGNTFYTLEIEMNKISFSTTEKQ